MKLSILIVNWNTRDLVVNCVNSILNYATDFDFEVVVVDNDSSDGSGDELRRQFGDNKNIKIIRASENLGFAKGNNLAFKHSTGEYILLLNPDTKVRPQALQKLVNYMESHKSVGAVGPKIINPDGTTQQSVRQFPRIFTSLLIFSGLHRWFRPKHYLMDGFDYLHEASVDQVMGAAFMTRRVVIEKLGFMDENFWLWYEEVDFCKRVKAAGYDVRFYPNTIVEHHQGQSFSQVSVLQRKKIIFRSLVYYFQKHGRKIDIVMLKVVAPLVFLLAWFFEKLENLGMKTKIHV